MLTKLLKSRETFLERDWKTHWKNERQGNRWTDGKTDRRTNKLTNRQTVRQQAGLCTDGQTLREMKKYGYILIGLLRSFDKEERWTRKRYRHSDIQWDWQTDRHTHIHR